MSTPALDLIGLGEAMVELFADRPLGEAASLTRGWGGDVLNALVTAADLGGRAGLITRIGKDPFGPDLHRLCRARGIDVSHAPLLPGENGVYFISVDARGEREFTYRRAGSAASTLDPCDLDADYLASARAVLLSGITQAISPSAQATTLHAARLAREAGALVAFDPNYRPALWAPRGGEAAARAAWDELRPLVNVLLPSFPDDLPALGVSGAGHPEAALDALRAQVPRLALKAAGRGALLAWPGTAPQAVPTSPVEVTDSTGAGDAWNGAFLLGLARGVAPVQAAREAHSASARVLVRRGALPPPLAPLQETP